MSNFLNVMILCFMWFF